VVPRRPALWELVEENPLPNEFTMSLRRERVVVKKKMSLYYFLDGFGDLWYFVTVGCKKQLGWK
jgi:hypothetical protein